MNHLTNLLILIAVVVIVATRPTPAPALAPAQAAIASTQETVVSPAPLEPAGGYSWFEVLETLRIVETGGQPRQGLGAVGDNGKSIGPYQVGVLYYQDATFREFVEAPVGGIAYDDLLNDRYASEAIVMSYMRRRAPEAFSRLADGDGTIEDVERVARLHNGGPTLSKTSATDGYWAKFLSAFQPYV